MLKAIWFVPPVVQGYAESRGLFDRAGVAIEGTLTGSSDQQFEALRDGSQDAAITAMDNVIMWNRRLGDGDFRIVAQVEANTGISLVARADFKSVAALAGKRLLVDSAENGFVVALRALLADAGVDFNACDVIEAGGVKDRLGRLLAGEGHATLLGPPFTEMAEAQGFRRLADADVAYPGFPGQGLVVRRRLIEARGDELVRWLSVLEQARAECRAAPAEVAAGMAASGLSQVVAERLAGFIGDSLLPSRAGIELLIGQRQRLGLPGGDADFESLVDLRPLAAIHKTEECHR